jgi:small-conductance mechanosensitive channel
LVAEQHDGFNSKTALFQTFFGFGNSSVNIRLYIWLAELSDILTIPSPIRQAVLNALIEAGI